MSAKLPQLACRELSAFDAGNLDAVRAAFASADAVTTTQAWQPQMDADFAPATVRAGWRGNSLLVFAELDDADIFSDATAHNQRMWELGDVLEMFLSPEGEAHYVELHVTPNNFRLQLRLPDTAAFRKAQAENKFDHLLLSDGVFSSRVWLQQEKKKWFVFAEIPADLVAGGMPALPFTGRMPVPLRWKFSFSRYDYLRGRKEPVYSSTSPHARLDFHRREEWGALVFI